MSALADFTSASATILLTCATSRSATGTEPPFHQLLFAVEIEDGKFEVRFGAREIGATRLERCPIGVLFDLVEHVAFGHQSPVGHQRFFERSADPGDDIHFVDGFAAADKGDFLVDFLGIGGCPLTFGARTSCASATAIKSTARMQTITE